VTNASVLGPTPLPYLLDYPLEDFRSVLGTNLVAPFLLIKKVLPAMVERGGSIINVTSDAGVVGYPGWGAYGISKFGIEGMSRTWAAELEGSGVRLNWVDPGSMNTAMHRAAEPDEDPSQWADPADVTGVFVYLASDESRGVHGRRFEAQEPGWGQPDAAELVAVGESTRRGAPCPRRSTWGCRPSWRPGGRPGGAACHATTSGSWSLTAGPAWSSIAASTGWATTCGPATCWSSTPAAPCRPSSKAARPRVVRAWKGGWRNS